MKLVKKIVSWYVVAFLALLALGTIPSFSCIAAILIAVLITPIKKWQTFLCKYIRGIIKVIVIAVLACLMLITLPDAETPNNTGDSNSTLSTIATDPTTEATTAPTVETATTPTTEPITEPATEPTTEPATEPTTEPATEPTTEPATEPATESTTIPPHTHSFSAATCTKPKTCSCGATEGKAKGHSYTNGTCSACGTKDPNYSEITYVLNTSTKKFHRPSCKRLPTENRQDTTMSREEIITQGYDSCGYCHP